MRESDPLKKYEKFIHKCNSCGKQRILADESNIPKRMKEGLKDFENEIDYYLYCTNCDEFSVLFKSEIF